VISDASLAHVRPVCPAETYELDDAIVSLRGKVTSLQTQLESLENDSEVQVQALEVEKRGRELMPMWARARIS